jgi:hypothetical protein
LDKSDSFAGSATSSSERMSLWSDVSFKGIAAGLFASLAATVLLSFLLGYYLVPVYNSIAASGSLLSHQFSWHALFHPLTLAFALLASFLAVGMPAYLAAVVANRRFVFHALVATAASVVLSCVASLEDAVQFPLALVAIAGWSLAIAACAGFFRKHQVESRREAP